MPYIPSSSRVGPEAGGVATDVGDLTYQFTHFAIKYLNLKGQRFQTYAEIIGALEATKLELYRRSVGPYEDTKIEQNGDCYPQELRRHRAIAEYS